MTIPHLALLPILAATGRSPAAPPHRRRGLPLTGSRLDDRAASAAQLDLFADRLEQDVPAPYLARVGACDAPEG